MNDDTNLLYLVHTVINFRMTIELWLLSNPYKTEEDYVPFLRKAALLGQ